MHWNRNPAFSHEESSNIERLCITSYKWRCTWSCLSPEFWSWKFGPPDRNFQWKNGPPGPFFFGKNGLPLEIWSGLVCCTFNTWKEVFSLSTAPTFPHILVSIWNLSLPCWEVLSPGTALGASVSAPIKAHNRFVSRKTSYLSRFFS